MPKPHLLLELSRLEKHIWCCSNWLNSSNASCENFESTPVSFTVIFMVCDPIEERSQKAPWIPVTIRLTVWKNRIHTATSLNKYKTEIYYCRADKNRSFLMPQPNDLDMVQQLQKSMISRIWTIKKRGLHRKWQLTYKLLQRNRISLRNEGALATSRYDIFATASFTLDIFKESVDENWKWRISRFN